MDTEAWRNLCVDVVQKPADLGDAAEGKHLPITVPAFTSNAAHW